MCKLASGDDLQANFVLLVCLFAVNNQNENAEMELCVGQFYRENIV